MGVIKPNRTSKTPREDFLPISGGNLSGPVTGTFVGDGSGLSAVTGTDSVYLMYRTDSRNPNGVAPDQIDEISYSADPTTRTFHVYPTNTEFSFWSDATRWEKTVSDIDSCTAQWSDTNGIHHFYFDENGILQHSAVFSDEIIGKWCYIANLYWNVDLTEVLFIGDEKHGMIMDSDTHGYLHRSAGSVYVNGLQLGDFNIGVNATFSCSDGLFFDEDIDHNIENGNPQTLSTTAYVPVMSLTGTDGIWMKQSATAWPLRRISPTGRPAYNEWTGTEWVQTEVPNNDYILAHIFATNVKAEPIISIQGQTSYKTITQAREGAITEIGNLVTVGLPMEEGVAVGTIIYECKDLYGDPKAVTVLTDEGDNYVNWTGSTISPGTGPGDHGNLTGLNDDDHSQYWLLGTGNYRVLDAALSGDLSVTGSISSSTLSGDGAGITNLQWTNISSTAHTHAEFDNFANYVPASGGTFTGSISANTVSGNIVANAGFEIETRTDDSVTQVGRMWLRTDL